MNKSMTSYPFLLLCTSLTLASCEGASSGPAPTTIITTSNGNFSLLAEENLGAFQLRISTNQPTQGAFTHVLGCQALVWRIVKKESTEIARVKITFGTFDGDEFYGKEFVQFSPADCDALLSIIETLDKSTFGEPWLEIKYQEIRAEHGGLKLRKFPRRKVELLAFTSAQSGLENWASLDVPAFRKFLVAVIEQARNFDKHPTTIKW